MLGDHQSRFIICGTQISVQNLMAINAIAVEILKTKVGDKLNDGTFPSPESQHPQIKTKVRVTTPTRTNI